MVTLGRKLDWPDCRNTRDLGGLQCGTGLTRARTMVRSDNISNLTPEGVRAMWAYGVNTVIDLRSESEVATSPSPFAPAEYGPQYLNLPLIDDSSSPTVAAAPGMAERYRLILDHRPKAFAQVFSTIAAADGAVLFHCFAGKDRTGLVAAMLLSLAGARPDAIAADYGETDLNLATKYEEWLATAKPERLDSMRDELRCPPEWMMGALDHLDRKWGGVKPYLVEAGMGPAAIGRLQDKLAP